MQTVTLAERARVLKRFEGKQLLFNGGTMDAGEVVVIGETQTMIFDHRDQGAIPIIDAGYEGCFFLADELKIKTIA